MKRIFLIVISPLAILLLFISLAEEPELGDYALVILPDGREISVQIAIDEEERQRGLMFREELEENEGMFFVFKEDGFHSFWMKNCRIALDIIWMDAKKRVVHIEEKVEPCRENEECPTIIPARKARYALEVRAGVVSSSHLKIGDELLLIPLLQRSMPGSRR